MAQQLDKSYAEEFFLSITRALADQLSEAMGALETAQLSPSTIEVLEPRHGVYELWKDAELAYVGKSDEALPDRLHQHYRKICGRKGITVDQISFRCLYVDVDLDAIAPERMLIANYTGQGRAPWQHSGFGNNDPGRERDTSFVNPKKHFDAWYPANLDVQVDIEPGDHELETLLQEAKDKLPWVLRYSRKPQHKKRREGLTVHVPKSRPQASELLHAVAEALPSDYQTTALPGYVIMYPERRSYTSARHYWRKDETGQLHCDTVGTDDMELDD